MNLENRKAKKCTSDAGGLFRNIPLLLLPLLLLIGIACFSWGYGEIASDDCGAMFRPGNFGGENESLALDEASRKHISLRVNPAGQLHCSARSVRSLPRVLVQKWQRILAVLSCLAVPMGPRGQYSLSFCFEGRNSPIHIFLMTSLPVRAGPATA